MRSSLRHAAVAGGGRRAHCGGGAAERFLHVGRQRAEAHAGDGDRDVELDRLCGEARAEHGLRRALLAIALERIARQRCAEEQQVVEVRQLALGAEAADLVQARGRGALDVVDRVRSNDALSSISIFLLRVGVPVIQRARARKELAVVGAFLRAPWDMERLDLSRGEPGLASLALPSETWKLEDSTRDMINTNEYYRESLPAADVERIESIVGERMRQYGYDHFACARSGKTT